MTSDWHTTGLTLHPGLSAIGLTFKGEGMYEIYADDGDLSATIIVDRSQVRRVIDTFETVLRWTEGADQ
jgi:hypothetical protein